MSHYRTANTILRNVFLATTGVCLIAFSTTAFLKERAEFRAGKYIVYASQTSNVLGLTNESSYLDVYFNEQIATSSPLIFGGAQVPNLEDGEAWEKMSEVGVNMVRKDFFLELSVPPNITVNDYLTNKNNVADPATWTKPFIDKTHAIYNTAQLNNMKTMGIVSYAPAWLTHTGEFHGIPTNWFVYEDIVKKIYRIHRSKLDYVEIWNEPSHSYFMKVDGLNISKEDAYLQIFLHASKAIREVDDQINDGKRTPIGGPVAHNDQSISFLLKLLENDKARQNLDFISFHHYGSTPPNWTPWKNALSQAGMQDTPIYLTEWNYTSEVKNNLSELTKDPAISYTGSMLINFLVNGIEGANYYSLFPVDSQLSKLGHGYLAYYQTEDGQISLLPQSKTWHLLAKTLGLGTQKSEIYLTNSSSDISSVGFLNADNKYGLAISNSSNLMKQVEVTIQNIPYDDFVSIYAYEASKNNDGSQEVSNTVLPIVNGKVSYKMTIPPYSVVGVLTTGSRNTSYWWSNFLTRLYQL